MTKQPITAEKRVWIDQSQGLVRAIATKIYSRLPSNVNYDDLVSYGQLGLMQAAHSFDPSKKTAFQTFAYHRIRGAIYGGLGKMHWTNRAVAQRIRAERLSAELLDRQIQAANAAEFHESLGEDADWLIRTTERIAVVHLLSDSSADETGTTLNVPDSEPLPDEVAETNELCGVLRMLVAELDAPERMLIESIYFEGKSITEAAEQQGKSKSWASRLHTRIIELLSVRLAARDLRI